MGMMGKCYKNRCLSMSALISDLVDFCRKVTEKTDFLI